MVKKYNGSLMSDTNIVISIVNTTGLYNTAQATQVKRI